MATPTLPIKLSLTGTGSIDLASLVTALTPYFVPRPVIPVVQPPLPPVAGSITIKRSGPILIDGNNVPVQLRGVNVSGLESTAVHGWAKNADGSYNYWGDSGLGTPDFNIVKTWKANVVRIPLNAASWLGLPCIKGDGTPVAADPGAVFGYQGAVLKAVQAATAVGLYVILDLHWSAPKVTIGLPIVTGNLLPSGQPPFANADTDLLFWQQVATAYMGYHNVIFELFNEPFLDIYGGIPAAGGPDQSMLMLIGGLANRFPNETGVGAYDILQNWNVLGFQTMTNAIRIVGATNLILVSCPNYAKKLSTWVLSKVIDPLDNIGAVWHLYPAYNTMFGSAAYNVPDWSPNAYPWAESVVAAGYPVVVTETGGHNTVGTPNEPFVTNALAWVDKMNLTHPGSVGVLGWGWNVWNNADNVLIKDIIGTPTDGYGKVYHDWIVSK